MSKCPLCESVAQVRGTTLIHAEEDDIFAFIPAGGRTLLADVLAQGVPDPMRADLLGGPRDGAQWLQLISADAAAAPALGSLDDVQRRTLADYLAYHMPLSPAPATLDAASLPRDGRDLALEYCQSCHIITVVVTQDRAREAWLGTMNKPSHIGVDLTEAERNELADYLVVNAGIPIEEVPKELRAGGASY